ncbi:MAG: hypothetical protein GYB41_15795 [Oceanospirillales bacterium]|nr:hypothetical protein [Oceanospirillales bacterium]
MKNIRGYKLLSIVALLFTVTGCSNSGLSESDVKSCILSINGYDDIGVPLESKKMGITYGSTIINSIEVQNIIPRGEAENIAKVVIEIGQKQIGVPEEDAEATAKMFGWEFVDGFIAQDVKTSYLFAKGSKGWACQEL